MSMDKQNWRSTRSFVNLRQGRTDWYRIQNRADAPGADVHIYDEIGYLGVTASDFVRDLGNASDPLHLHLNTPGGEIFDGLAIYGALKQRPDVAVTIDGLAASIGSVIAQAASPGKLKIAKHASMMIHDGFSMAVGNAADMRALADVLDQQSDVIAGIYAQRTGKPASYWRDQMKQESWFTGEKAVECGLADSLSDAEAVKNSWDLSIFRNVVPSADANPADSHPPMTGTHTHAHSSFGNEPDSMGDGAHEHEHTHNGDNRHDHDHDGVAEHDLDGQGMTARYRLTLLNEKYSADDRRRMASNGEAMDDGSYPIADEEDLHNAIHAVGRGKNNSHEAIRAHIIKRAKALGMESAIPDDWTQSSNRAADVLLASLFRSALGGVK